MQSITKEYLLDIIYRKISATIHVHRKQHPPCFTNTGYSKPTAEEVLDFVFSIPYFDGSLKKFLTANHTRQTIISQAWELEFIKKCELWMQSYEWLYGKPYCQGQENNCPANNSNVYLTLPY